MVNKVLLADDSATIQKLVEMALSDSDFHLLAVSDGQQAVDRLSEFQPDVILADAIMPKLNGYEVCQHVKSNPAFRHIPVILLTGRFQPFDEDQANQVGIDKRVVKPFSQDQLVSAMLELIEAAAAEAAPVDELTEETFSVDEPDDFSIDDSEDSFTLPEPAEALGLPPEPMGLPPEPEVADAFEELEDDDDDGSIFDERATIQANPEELKARLQELQPDKEDLQASTPDIDAFSFDSEDEPEAEPEPEPATEPMELHTEDLEEFSADDLDDDDLSEFNDDQLLDDDLEGIEDDELELSEADLAEPAPGQAAEPAFPEAAEMDSDSLTLEDSDDDLQFDEPADELGLEDELSGEMALDNDQIEELDDADFAQDDVFASSLPDADDDTQPVSRDSAPPAMADYDQEAEDETLSLDGHESDDEDDGALTLDEFDEEDDDDLGLSLDEFEPAAEDDTLPTPGDQVPMYPDPEELVSEELDDELDLSADGLEMETLDDIEPVDDDLSEEQPIHSDADTLEVSNAEMEEIRDVSRSRELSEEDFDLDLELGDEEENGDFEIEEVDEPLIPEMADEVIEPESAHVMDESALAMPQVEEEEALDFGADSSDFPTERLEDPFSEEESELDVSLEESDILEVEENVTPPVDSAPVSLGELSLSEEQMEDLSKRVADHLVKSVGTDFVREVVWQVIPELSEAMIKKRIYQLEQAVDDN